MSYPTRREALVRTLATLSQFIPFGKATAGGQCLEASKLSILGRGYKSYSGSLGGQLLLQENASCSGSDTIIDFGILGSTEDYERATSVSASASGSYGGASLSLDGNKSFSLNQHSTVVRLALTKRVVRNYYELSLERPIRNASPTCSSALAFVDRYGDEVVYKVGV